MEDDDSKKQRVWYLSDGNPTQEERIKEYDNFCTTYEQVFGEEGWQSPYICAETVGTYITDNRDRVEILDLGVGTGLVGKRLHELGFRIFDGIDPSQGMLTLAKQKHIYRNLYCQFFTSEPTKIKEGSYDACCISGAFGKGDIPEDSVYEMIRLGKPGCILCFVGRTVAFELLLPLLETLEKNKQLKKEEITETQKYRKDTPALIIVYRIIKD
ncbi:methyltransferase-like protein 27 [Mytilus galloprovincialis]|uniref:methyltransferase-like protein 27 n=1 Tax=Mytilus galloprovincialis TaxID=29158 RepID=UPI003F7CA50A